MTIPPIPPMPPVPPFVPAPPMPPARRRPGVVTAACALLGLVSLLSLVGVLLSLLVSSDLKKAYDKAYEGYPDLETAASVTSTVTTVSGVGVGVVVAICVGVLALLNAQGKNPARITTWVLGGIFLCCSTVGLAGNALSGALTSGGNGKAPDAKTITAAMDEFLPSWYSPVSTTVSVMTMLCLLAAVILLALPGANAYFRKPEPVWEPPLPPMPPTTI